MIKQKYIACACRLCIYIYNIYKKFQLFTGNDRITSRGKLLIFLLRISFNFQIINKIFWKKNTFIQSCLEKKLLSFN